MCFFKKGKVKKQKDSALVNEEVDDLFE